MIRNTRLVALTVPLLLSACGSDSGGGNPAPFDPGATYAPDVQASALSTTVTNDLFPLPVGATWTYEAATDEGTERIEIAVLSETEDVWGTSARVVRDTVTVAGVLAEDTWDWYGQDPDGNVWYLGENTFEYAPDGSVICSCGAWTAGVMNALPGVVMLGQPSVGSVYRQEYLAGEAEDYAEVLSTNETVTVPAGTFSGCLKTRDRSAIDPELDEAKYYCPGVGNVLVEEGDVRVELLSYSGL
jgi:hypothetical protein